MHVRNAEPANDRSLTSWRKRLRFRRRAAALVVAALALSAVPVAAASSSYTHTTRDGDLITTSTVTVTRSSLSLKTDVSRGIERHTFVSALERSGDAWVLHLSADGVLVATVTPRPTGAVLTGPLGDAVGPAPGTHRFESSNSKEDDGPSSPTSGLPDEVNHLLAAVNDLFGGGDTPQNDLSWECFACAAGSVLFVGGAIACTAVLATPAAPSAPGLCAGIEATMGAATGAMCTNCDRGSAPDWSCGSSIALVENDLGFFDIKAWTTCSEPVTIMMSPVYMTRWFYNEATQQNDVDYFHVGIGNYCALTTYCQNSWTGVNVLPGCYIAHVRTASKKGFRFADHGDVGSNMYCVRIIDPWHP